MKTPLFLWFPQLLPGLMSRSMFEPTTIYRENVHCISKYLSHLFNLLHDTALHWFHKPSDIERQTFCVGWLLLPSRHTHLVPPWLAPECPVWQIKEMETHRIYNSDYELISIQLYLSLVRLSSTSTANANVLTEDIKNSKKKTSSRKYLRNISFFNVVLMIQAQSSADFGCNKTLNRKHFQMLLLLLLLLLL